MSPKPAVCYSCGSIRVRHHCTRRDGSTCDWMVCNDCGSWGTIDGRRWVRKVPET